MRRLICFGWIAMCLGCLPSPAENAGTSTTPSAPQGDPNFVARPAEVGVGIQGRSLQNDQGIDKMITAPAAAYFRVKEQAVFDIQLKQAMDLYQAEKGYFPRSHEEYMETIVNFNRIKLPKLPAGQIYRYHPDDHTLWVEPDNNAQSQPPATP